MTAKVRIGLSILLLALLMVVWILRLREGHRVCPGGRAAGLEGVGSVTSSHQGGELEIYYHAKAEVDPVYSWIANSQFLSDKARPIPYDECRYSRVLALTEYARPDLILAVDGIPYLSGELTKMNPSGHNLPQRFSCLVKASELGITSFFYYPEYSRRTVSDKNPRYLNVRVPLGQMRLGELYGVPSVSLFWPTNPTTLLPQDGVAAHAGLAAFIEYTAHLALARRTLNKEDVQVRAAVATMSAAVEKYSAHQGKNPTFEGVGYPGREFIRSVAKADVHGPPAAVMVRSGELLNEQYKRLMGRKASKNRKAAFLQSREYTLLYRGVPNDTETGPEHPYPGYLTLLDVLYLRLHPNGQTSRDRNINLAFQIDLKLRTFERGVLDRTTGLNILTEFADLLILEDALVVGGWLRNLTAGAVLTADERN